MSYDVTRDPHLATWRERIELNIKLMRCPACNRVGYKPYIHPDGTIVAEECGKCDHESSCGYHIPPKEWFKEHSQDGDHTNPNYVPPPSPPAIKIDRNVALQVYCLGPKAVRNPLLRYWTNLIRNVAPKHRDTATKYVERMKAALRQFMVGSLPGGYTVWWIVDETGSIRSGKCMKYRSDGHRDKEDKFGFRWMHRSPLVGQQKEGAEYVGCLFGLHQLKNNKDIKEVQIVESEKTAVLMTMFKPTMTWMATMGLGNLNQYRLAPLIERGIHITCHPDIDGYGKWGDKVEQLKHDCPEAKITLSDYVKDHYYAIDSANTDILDEFERDYILLYSP